MSADNWTQCPVCKERDPFLGVTNAELTWREDCELGINRDGSFDVMYSGGCRVCGTTFKFKHEVTAAEVLRKSTGSRP